MAIQLPPEHYAKDIIRSFELKTPIDAHVLCRKFKIEVIFESLSDAEAYFICKNANKKIIINDKIQYDSRVKFTIAHEIGHFYLPWHNYDIFKCRMDNIFSFNSNNILENEANTFASELLIPENEVMEDIRNKDVSLRLIKDLALKYGVSITSIAIKVVKNTDRRVAIVFSKDGRIKWNCKSNYFNREIITGALRRWSYAYDFFAEKNTDEIIDSVYSMAWLINGTDSESIIEESLPMTNLNSVLTIINLHDQDDEDYEE